jgi:hypothetical protein
MRWDHYAVVAFDLSGAFTGQYATACATCRTATVTGLDPSRPYLLGLLAHNARGWGVPVFTGA